MGRKKKKEKRRLTLLPQRTLGHIKNDFGELQSDTRRSVFALLVLAVGLFLLFAPFSLSGRIGEALFNGLTYLFGVGYYLLPVIAFALTLQVFFSIRQRLGISTWLGVSLFLLSFLGLIEIAWAGHGGLFGRSIANPALYFFETIFASLLLSILLVVGIIIAADIPLRRRRPDADDQTSDTPEDELIAIRKMGQHDLESANQSPEPSNPEESLEPTPAPGLFSSRKNKEEVTTTDKTFSPSPMQAYGTPYQAPPISLFSGDKGKPSYGDIKARSLIIQRTLKNFGITVEMDDITVGPTVTRYALKPAEGVKLTKILSLQSELSLALAAHPIRIEAPIPGKSLVGIEIPNSVKTTVGLASLLQSAEFKNTTDPLTAAIGKDITGRTHVMNIAKAPHTLVAGATGAGKSVTMHALITSLLYRNSPESLRLLMVDPKRVELTLYNGIPHLLNPVITKSKEAVTALKWAVKEMERRYNVLEENQVQNIVSYHKNVLEPWLKKHGDKTEAADRPEAMPYIIFIIDELNDLMQSYGREVEAGIVRLAQMSRAVGMHLVIATQRPSVNVITGTIKANIPARIALKVTSQIDSRTIIDTGGAEKLLGKGDMLFVSGESSKPTRIQSAFISEDEVKKVVKHLTDTYKEAVVDGIDLEASDKSDAIFSATLAEADDETDELFDDAKDVVVEAGKASTSLLQRRLGIGYGRAARIMDQLESTGVIGPPNGSKPREILGATPSEETEANDI